MGIVVRVNEIHYLIPLTSYPKRKEGRRRNARTTVEVIVASLINNMIPVPITEYNKVDIGCDRDKD